MSDRPAAVKLRRTGALGDVIMATPVLARLRREHGPDAYIEVETGSPLVFEGNVAVSRVRPSWFAGFDAEHDLDLAYERKPEMHAIDAYMAAVFGDLGEASEKTARLHRESPPWLHEADLSRAVIVHPARSWRNRTMPASFWFHTAGQLIDSGMTVHVVGSATDTMIAHPGVHDLRGKLSLHEVAALIQASRCFIGSDSALLHVAGTTDTPIIGIYTSVRAEYRMPYRQGILGHNVFPAVPPLSCYGCLKDELPPVTTLGCRRGDFLCVDMIDIITIWRQAVRLVFEESVEAQP